MKRQKTKKVNGLLIFSVCLLILAIATPLTLAFFTAQRGGTKTISFGKIELDPGVTTVSTTMESLVPGDKIFDEDVIVAKDIFSEDMIVRAKATYASEDATTPIVGLSGNISIQNMLNGTEFIYQNAYGHYIVTYYALNDNTGTALTGYSNAAGRIGAAGTTGYYVLANTSATPADDLVYLGFSGDPGEEVTDYFIIVSGTKYKTNINGQYLNAGGTVVEEANRIAYTGTPIEGTLQTAKFVARTKAVDAAGNIYDQYIILGGTAAASTYHLIDTGEDTATGDATGYRWVYNFADNYYYLAAWAGDSNASSTNAEKYNNPDPATALTLDVALSTAKFYNITKPNVLKADATYDLTGIAATGKTQTLDIDSAASRTAMINYYTNSDIFVVDGSGIVTSIGSGTVSLATLKTTLDTNKESLVTAKETLATAQATYEASEKTSADQTTLNNAVNAYSSVKTNYDKAVTNYNKALHLLAEVLGDAQKLFYFVSSNTVIPTELSQVTSLYGKTFTVGVEFNAIQSNYLQVGGTSYTVADTTIAAMLTAFTDGNTLFGVSNS